MSPIPAPKPAVAEAPLEAAQLAQMRQALEDCRQDRLRQLSALEDVLADDSDPLALVQTASLQNILQSIDAALARIDDGTYGRCVHCSTLIPLPRLELVPYTDGCVDCRRSRA